MIFENEKIIIKVAIYLRYSSNMQTEQSIEGQKRVVTEYANKNSMQIRFEYIDRERSGRNEKRENFQQMIDDIENNNIDVDIVLVYKLDRFFRNEKLHRKYENILTEKGIKLISATESVNDGNLGDKIMKSVMLFLNEEESKKISMNVARGKKETAYKCMWCGGTPPLGYDVDRDSKTLIINKNEAKIIKYAFKLRYEGFSYSYIIEKLNKKGYKTKLGNDFGKNSLFEIFRNIKYKGTYEYNRAASKSENGKFNRHASKNEDGCNLNLFELLEGRIDELTKENKKTAKKINSLETQKNFTPTMDEIKLLKDSFICYMQDKVNMPIRKAFLQEVIEKITVTDDDIEIFLNL